MPDGLTHYKYFKKGYKVEIPFSLFLLLINWKFALGNAMGFFAGRWIDP